MGKFSEDLLFGMTIRESATDGSDFTNPAADYRRLFLGEDGALHVKDSAGAVTTIGGTSSFVGCFAYNNTTQAFNETTLTYMALNAEAYDTSTFHDNSTNNSRLVAPVTGYYRITGGIWYATTSGTNYILLDYDHGASYIRGGAVAQNGGSSGVTISTVAYLTATHYIEMVGYHTQAGSITTGDVGTTISQQNYLAMELIGV
jgi:hypothetical protein